MVQATPQRIAILGFGFSGLMVAANLVRDADRGLVLYIIAEEKFGLGLAYSTTDMQHLLNVPAAKMGAFADAVDGFHQWLQGDDAAQQKQRLQLSSNYTATDFVPRALYGAYLQSIWLATQEMAAQKNIAIKLVPSHATGIAARGGLAVLSARGDAIAVDHIVLATGHETKPVMAHIPPACVLQNPWAAGSFADANHWSAPVVLMGTGLTAVDTIMSLRHAGYTGEIMAFSRHGLLPCAHGPSPRDFLFNRAALFAQPSLAALLRYVRRQIAQHGEWRDVIDGLRPHSQALWQKLSTRDQRRFLARHLSFWSIHRHRMAPEIAARMAGEIGAGSVRIVASKRFEAKMVEGQPVLTLQPRNASQGAYEIMPGRIINCTGPEINVARSQQVLMMQALADGLVEPHATGLGIAVDPECRAWGNAYPNLSAVGPLMTGQWLESTAVPELRVQAAQVAADILTRG
jgi:uncharacterized NAD(P)/FAD-binding protein YdhS